MTNAERNRETTVPAIPRSPRAVWWIVALSVGLFFLQFTVFDPSDVETVLAFATRDLGYRWWTVATFTLVHGSTWTLGVNLLAIGVFGSALERAWGTGEFVRYYIACSLGAWIAHVTFVAGSTVLAGAAAPAIGAMLAYAALARDAKHFQVGAVSVSAGWLAVVGTLGILLAGVGNAPPGDATAYLVHTGGLVAGWVYLRTASSVNLTRLREAVSPVPDEPEDVPPRAIPRGHARAQRIEDDIVARSNAAVAREASAQPSAPPVEGRDGGALDRLLDKISAHGIESLTEDERKLLDDVSRRLRDH